MPVRLSAIPESKSSEWVRRLRTKLRSRGSYMARLFAVRSTDTWVEVRVADKPPRTKKSRCIIPRTTLRDKTLVQTNIVGGDVICVMKQRDLERLTSNYPFYISTYN